MMTQSAQEVKPFNTGTVLAAIEAGLQPTAQDWAAFSALSEDEQDRLLDKLEDVYPLLSKSEQNCYWAWKPTLTGLFLDAMRANITLAKRWF